MSETLTPTAPAPADQTAADSTQEFLAAVLENNFMEAAGRADAKNQRALQGWAIFVHNFTPLQCHGSPQRVAAWITKGGILGQEAA